jgi:hypothetical protein
MTTKPLNGESLIVQAQGCIVDASHLADLIEMAADHMETRESSTISGAVRVAAEKLQEAMELLNKAEAGKDAA